MMSDPARDPNYHYQRAVELRERGQTDELIAALRRVVDLAPGELWVWNELAMTLAMNGRLPEAVQIFRWIVTQNGTIPEAFFNLGNGLRDLGDLDGALAAYRRATELRPGYSEAYINMAVIADQRWDFSEAERLNRLAIAANPKNPNPHNNLGNVFKEQGLIREAIECYREALRLDPSSALAHENLLYSMHYHPAFSPEEMFAEVGRWARVHAQGLYSQVRAHPNDRDPQRRIRVGYVSPHFRHHVVMFFLEPLLAHHDHDAFEIFCYSATAGPDEDTPRLMRYADRWRDIRFASDEQAAQMIREDRIDVLVDLMGHIEDNRLLIFARKPAPVQVTYLGYPDTTGLSTMDYRLTDAVHDPPGATERWHTEKLVRMEGGAWCFRPPGELPEVSAAPFERPVNEDGIEFWGQSFVCAPNGQIARRASIDKEEVLIVPCDLEKVEFSRTHWPFLRDRRIDAYGDLTRRFVDAR